MEKDFKIHPSIIYLAWAAAAFFYFYQYIFRIIPGIMADEIRIDLKMNAEEFSVFCSLYLYAYSLIQIPMGVALDKFGIKKTLVSMIVLCVIGSAMTAYIHEIYFSFLGRTLTGIGAGAAFLSAIKIVSDFVPEGKRGILIGSTLTIGTLTAMILSGPLADMNSFFGWNSTYSYVSIFGLIVLAAVIVLVQDLSGKESGNRKNYGVIASIKGVMGSRYLFSYSIVGIGLYLPLSVLADLWGVSFIKMKFQLSTLEAAHINSYLYMGAALGALVIPWYFERINKIDLGIKISFFSIITLYVSLLYSEHYQEIYLKPHLFVIGFFSGSIMLCFTGAARYFSPDNSGVALGLINTLNMLGGAILQNIVGTILDKNWQGLELDNDIRGYGATEYQWALSSVILVMLMGLIVSILLLKDKKTKGTK